MHVVPWFILEKNMRWLGWFRNTDKTIIVIGISHTSITSVLGIDVSPPLLACVAEYYQNLLKQPIRRQQFVAPESENVGKEAHPSPQGCKLIAVADYAIQLPGACVCGWCHSPIGMPRVCLFFVLIRNGEKREMAKQEKKEVQIADMGEIMAVFYIILKSFYALVGGKFGGQPTACACVLVFFRWISWIQPPACKRSIINLSRCEERCAIWVAFTRVYLLSGQLTLWYTV